MNLDEIQNTYSQNKLNISLEKLQDGSSMLILYPLDIKHLEFASSQAYRIGIDLCKLGRIQSFNSGINANITSEGNLVIKVYLLLNQNQNGKETVTNSISYLYCSTPPHIEDTIKNLFPNKKGGFFIESSVLNGITNSPTKFFEEFMDWTGIIFEAGDQFEELKLNRTCSAYKNKLTSLEKEKNSASNISYQSFLQTKFVTKPDWFHLNEVGQDLIDVLSGFPNDSKNKPRVITLRYDSPEISLHQVKDLLSSKGYKLAQTHYQYSFFTEAA